MKPSVKYIFLLVAAMWVQVAVFAQDFTASVSASKVGVGERLRLTYVIKNKSIEKFVLPQMSDFSIVGGPYQSTSTQIVNGNYSQSSTIAYDLVSTKVGKYIIGGASLKTGGQTIVSNSVEVEITKEAQQAQRQQQQQRHPHQAYDPFNPFGQQQQQQPAQEVSVSKNDLFIVTSLSKSSVYPGEPVTVTFKLYSRFPQVNLEDIKFPEYKDAWVNELKETGDRAFTRESYNGQSYNAAVLQKTLFIPQRSGNIDIKAVTAKVLVQFTQRTGNMWEDFFNGGRVRQERMEVTGNNMVLKVKEYPKKDKPASFNGATGNYSMTVKTDRDSLSVNDAITVKVTISGSGNLSLVAAPKLNFPSVFEVFDPKSSENISVKPGAVSGNKTFEYLAIPRSPGRYTIDPAEFSFFNPQTGKYNTLVSDSIKLRVTGDASAGSVVDASGKISENIIDDIRYIKSDFSPTDKLSGLFPGIFFFAALTILFVATIAFWFLRTLIWDRRNDTDRKRTRIADSVAVKRLKKAERFLADGKKTEFYEECHRSVIQYLQDRKGIQLSEVSGDKIKSALLEKQVSETLAAEAKEIIAVCEMARYAPPGNAAELSDFHTRCIAFISNMEKK